MQPLTNPPDHLPEYLSYSSLNTYEECPRAWYLGRLKRAEPKQTYFFPVGTAVHQAIEHHIAGEDFDIKSIFYGLINKQLAIDPDDVNWLSGGSAEDPTIRGKALAQVEACVENAVKFLENFAVTSVERELLVKFPGCEVPVKMFIDLTGEHEKLGPLIVDWKTGKSKPKSPLQLEIYGAGLLIEDGFPMEHDGYWGMLNPATTAKTDKAKLVPLGDVNPVDIGRRFQAAYDDMKRKLYKANPGYGCKWCIQAPNCNVESLGSARANYYDKSSEDGLPF